MRTCFLQALISIGLKDGSYIHRGERVATIDNAREYIYRTCPLVELLKMAVEPKHHAVGFLKPTARFVFHCDLWSIIGAGPAV
ncbi:hypothetical protein AFLA_004691 [Aspergillus flavus NRRL3357]|nr:hypothetical protein AFLA_004691 [Aspergillus flavus NRRL3357]